MNQVFCCTHALRIEAIREHATLNAIEYLEVIDRDAHALAFRQKTLLATCVKPLTDAPEVEQVHITGGVRIRPIVVRWTALASQAGDLFTSGVIASEERDYLLALDASNRIVVIRVETPGDYDYYTLRFGVGPAPLAGFDRVCSAIEFSFKVECPSPFDCTPACEHHEKTDRGPSIDYRARDYDSFKNLMFDRLKVTLPEWKDRSPADLGVAIIEALAFEADRLTYYQDAVGADAYLGAARTRTAVRRHARLLDYAMHDGCNARALATILVEEGVVNLLVDKQLPAGERVQIITALPGADTVLDPRTAAGLKEERNPTVFEPVISTRLFNAHNEIQFYTWGNEECCLPAGATSAVLRDDLTNRLMLRPGDILIFEEVISPRTARAEDADPNKRHAVRLVAVSPEARVDEAGVRTAAPADLDPLFDIPIVHIEWSTEDALPFAMHVSARVNRAGRSSLFENCAIVRGNVLLIDNGDTQPPDPLPASTSHPDYRPVLSNTGITFGAPYAHEHALSAASYIKQNPRDAMPHIFCTDQNSIRWDVRRTLFDSDPFDFHFVIETEDDGSAALRFGDGVQGFLPPAHPRFEAVYRIGNGAAGNVGRDTLTHIVYTSGAGILGIRNPIAASGGVNPETREDVRTYAPQAFRVQERAVTEDDYETIAQRHPDVQKAYARRRWTGSWHTLFIAIDLFDGLEVTDAFEAEMVRFFDRYRMAGRDIEIVQPQYVSLDIALNVCIREGYRASDIYNELTDLFSAGFRRNGSRGYFHPDNFTFGVPVYLSPIVDLASSVAGVSRLTVSPEADMPGVFKRWGEPQRTEIDDGVIAVGEDEIVRCMNDPNRPEHGRIEFHIGGGS